MDAMRSELRAGAEPAWLDEFQLAGNNRDKLRSVLRAFAANLRQNLALPSTGDTRAGEDAAFERGYRSGLNVGWNCGNAEDHERFLLTWNAAPTGAPMPPLNASSGTTSVNQDYLADLKHDLHDEEFALAYLSACAMDSMDALRIGLRDVLAAQKVPAPVGEPGRTPTISFDGIYYDCAECGPHHIRLCHHWKALFERAHAAIEAATPPAQGAPTPPYHEFDKSFDVAQGAPGTRESALEEAAKECERVATMSMSEIEKLVPGWTSSELGSEVVCSAAIRALAQPGAPTKEGIAETKLQPPDIPSGYVDGRPTKEGTSR
jgi:hypothetical protein